MLLRLPAAIRQKGHFLPDDEGMKSERNGQRDVRWLNEAELHAAVLAEDAEAFAELMWRYDPLVRKQLAGCAGADGLEAELAEFWCGMIADDLQALRSWHPGRGGTLGQWLIVLAAYACNARLRQVARAA